MLVLTAPTNANLDLSQCVTDWQFDCVPNFEYNRLQNNRIVKRYDLGPTKDKYYSTVSLTMSFVQFQNFVTWYSNYAKGQVLTVNTDLDLFFPNIYSNNNCVIIEYKDLGYLAGAIFNKTRLITLRLYSPTLQSYTLSPIAPPCFSRGIWQQDYSYSSKINIVQNGLSYQFTEFINDASKWSVSFNLLTRHDANDLLAWILSVRTTELTITNNALNSNSSASTSSYYNIESFNFKNYKTYYTLVLQMTQNESRPPYVG